jgi:hypothetical protein
LTPSAGVVVATGRDFAVLELPAAAGARLVARARAVGVPIGPIAEQHGRWSVFVTGSRHPAQPFIRRDRLIAASATFLGAGRYVCWPVAGPAGGSGRWLRPPAGADWLSRLPSTFSVLEAAESTPFTHQAALEGVAGRRVSGPELAGAGARP